MLALADPFPSVHRLARLATPLAAYLALRVYTAYEAAPSAAAEGAFLSLLVAVLLGAVALIGIREGREGREAREGGAVRWPDLELGAGALLSVAAAWVLPPGPARGTAIGILLASTFLIAAWRRMARLRPEEGLPPELAVALALGGQVLLRGHLLFAPERTPKTLFALFVLPLVGAGAAWWMARRHGARPVVTAMALTLLLAPGWNVSSTSGWIALAAGEALVRREGPLWIRILALVAGMALVARHPGLALAGLSCGAALALPLPAMGAALLAGLLLWTSSQGSGFGSGANLQVLWVLLLVPSLLVPQRRLWPAPLITLFLVAAIPLFPNPGVLAAPVALGVLAASTSPLFAIPRQVGAAALFFATAVLAGYPWLRVIPLPSALELFGLVPSWTSVLILLAAMLGLAALGWWRTRRAVLPETGDSGVGSLALASGLALIVAACLALPRGGVALLTPEIPVLLDAAQPAWGATLAGEAVGSVTIESSLSNGAPLADGTPIATLRLFDPTGKRHDWELLAGRDSGEWAALRPDVRGNAKLSSPQPWVSWVADGFFAQRYRSRRELGGGFRAERIEIERNAALPAEVSFAVHQVEVAP